MAYLAPASYSGHVEEKERPHASAMVLAYARRGFRAAGSSSRVYLLVEFGVELRAKPHAYLRV